MSQTEGGKLTVQADVTGLSPGSHGFHVHQLGDITDGCGSTGGHFNPEGTNHGAFSDARSHRHFGDLKSLFADGSGAAA